MLVVDLIMLYTRPIIMVFIKLYILFLKQEPPYFQWQEDHEDGDDEAAEEEEDPVHVARNAGYDVSVIECIIMVS